jgi:16S rRNA (guanine(966)-N(2))-methyltransferase RsmD
MRIYGNRELKTLSGQETRPTTAKVREALFNIWQGKIKDCSWLDLCTGNGIMGGEALCRGAKEVVGIEKNNKACYLIKENWEKIAQPEQNFKLLKGDILTRLNILKGQEFDLIYFDPPYQSNLYEPVLNKIVQYSLLKLGGEIAVEHNNRYWPTTPIEGLEICRQKIYGNTSLTFYTVTESNP